MNATMHGFYSAIAVAKGFKPNKYKLLDGTVVMVTAVYETPEIGRDQYNWNDAQYIGKVRPLTHEEFMQEEMPLTPSKEEIKPCK